MSTLQSIFTDHYEEIIYTLHPRKTEVENIEKMIHCGDPSHGGAMFGCPHCGNLKFSPFRCKSRFCPSCGTDTQKKETAPAAEIKCSSCSAKLTKNSKFCPECGKKYNPCAKCGADMPEGASACPVCGEKTPTVCSRCGHSVPANMKFCPECGNSMVAICSSCGKQLDKGTKFCPECGTLVK